MQVHKKIFRIQSFFLLILIIIPYQLTFAKTIVLFSPDDKPTTHLIKYINNAKKKIVAAIYMLTDKKIAQALINAKQKRKIDVQVVTDKISVKSRYGKIKLLKKAGVDIFVFKPQRKTHYPALMHNKFIVFDEKKVWTGSFNWTISGNKKNQENVLCTDNKKVCQKYINQFEKLKKRCKKLVKTQAPS